MQIISWTKITKALQKKAYLIRSILMQNFSLHEEIKSETRTFFGGGGRFVSLFTTSVIGFTYAWPEKRTYALAGRANSRTERSQAGNVCRLT